VVRQQAQVDKSFKLNVAVGSAFRPTVSKAFVQRVRAVNAVNEDIPNTLHKLIN
jgi:hypothetical protein